MTDEKTNSGEKPKAPQWLIDNIAEASKNTRKIYLLYLGFLAYCALTAISTTDRTLVLNEPAHLPIVNVGVPLEGFFIFAPILAILTFIYLQFYLQNLNNMKSELTENYAPVDKNRLYPWIVNVIVISRLSTRNYIAKYGLLGYIEREFVYFVMWWILPIVLIIFTLTYLKKHDMVMSYYLASLTFISILLMISFWSRYDKRPFLKYIGVWNLKTIFILLILFYEVFIMAFVIPQSRQGNRIEFLIFRNFVDLSYQVLVNEPKTDYEGIYWGDFSGAHLEGANLGSTVLKRANLSGAYFREAFLMHSNLRDAAMFGASFQGSILSDADLRGADLKGTDLQGAELIDAGLQGADLSNSNLQGADFSYADLQGADLSGANLQEAVLWEASFQRANLSGADLQGADLLITDLQGADISDADFQRADLRTAVNLTIEQLSEVKTLYNAQLDATLLEQIEADYDRLREPPEKEEERPSP